MGLFSKLDKHSGLIGTMAETVHVDLTEAMANGQLSGQELRNAVMACMGCEGVCDCAEWLEAHKAGADATPSYCRNAGLMARLQQAG